MTLPRSFYDRPTLDVARDLIGKVLVHNRRGTLTSGIIVEVEAYIGESDPACHAAPGRTTRNAPLYGPPGYAYVYLNYGIHSLVNVVTESADAPAAVLIRALDPLTGISVMRRRRARSAKGRSRRRSPSLAVHDICRGPGNLTMAMGITLAENRADLCGDVLFIEALAKDAVSRPDALVWGPRIGISVGTEHPWRVYLEGHPAVSGQKKAQSAKSKVEK
ncbi:MAG TPA: DNA-3-methyladenine glycosylase [Candidatus Limnocylindrales bacterium]|nr:DNA-3-methyladenine glycosylase [Candidatus Limnocylindrales bacterium]